MKLLSYLDRHFANAIADGRNSDARSFAEIIDAVMDADYRTALRIVFMEGLDDEIGHTLLAAFR